MKTIARFVTVLLILTLPIHAAENTSHWTITGKIHVGGEGGWDWVTVEPAMHRLFLSHSSHVVVVDLKTRQVTGSMDAAGVHGIALAPELKRGFFSNGGDGTVTIFDLGTLKILGKVKVGLNPDAVCYEPVTQRVFAFNGHSASATVFEATKGMALKEIPLGGKPEFAQPDGRGGVFVNLEDKSKVLKIDAEKMKIVEQWSLPEESEPSALSIDTVNHRLFIGCGNKKLFVMDSTSGKIITTLPIGKGVDADFYDSTGKRIFASCGDGTLTVIHQDSADQYTVEEMATTEKGARTMGFDPTTSTIYLPVAKFGPPPPPTPEHPKPHSSIVPDTLEILIVNQQL